MAYEVWWALVLGFAISAIVQAWVPRERIEARAVGQRPRPGRQGHGARRGVLVLLLRRDRDRQVAVREGGLGGDRARLPVRLDQPRLGAGPGPLGADRLAVHARRVRRRDRDDRADGGEPAAVRLPAARGAGAAPRPGGRRPDTQHPPPATRACTWRQRLTSRRRLVRRRRQLPRRLADALEGDHRSASCSPASSACWATTSSTSSSSPTRRRS